MTDITFRDDVTVELRNRMGDDVSLLEAMLVSTGKDHTAHDMEKSAQKGRLNFLMKNRHGTPFEHGSMTFYIEAPIFVFREYHRHRSWSYNEMSGRYRELPPTFYVPARERNLIQTGKPGEYQFVPGDDEQYREMSLDMRSSCVDSYGRYRRMLDGGVAKEVARMVLPVSIYTAMYATANPRSIMAFLSLRTGSPEATYPSTPMREIEMVAEKIEEHFSMAFPLTHEVFCNNGRVSP